MSGLPISTGSPLYAIQLTEAVINTCWQTAEEIKVETQTAIANAGSSFIDPDNPPEMIAAVVTPTSVTEPSVTIPDTIEVADIVAAFDAEQAALVADLADKFTSFRATFFTDEDATYTAAEDWLRDSLADPSVAMPAAVAAQIWEEDRSRILADSSRASADVLATFASRRYPLPPGAAAAAVIEIEQKAQSELSASSRKVAVMSVEQMRSVIDKVLSLRQSAMAAALDYVKTLAFGMDMASRVVSGGYDAQSRLISAAATFFNARTAAKELEFKGDQMNAQLAQEAGKANLQSALSTVEMRLKSLLQEAELLGRMAQALYNNLHANAGASASFSETQAT